jgi:hypothetical protein
MGLPPLLIQTAGSLAAILALAALARWMKLGGTPRIACEADIRRAANMVEDGFAPVETACDAEGAGALARDQDGRIMLIRRHGNRFAGRVLTGHAAARASGHVLTIDCGERRFGTTRLELDDAQTWADAINALSIPGDA